MDRISGRSNGERDDHSNGKRKTYTHTKSGYEDNPCNKRTAFSPSTSTSAARATIYAAAAAMSTTSDAAQPQATQRQEDEPIPVDESAEGSEEEAEEVGEGATRKKIDKSEEEGEEEGEEIDVPVILSDLRFLDCPICRAPLKHPVYQCKNGHLACESCCKMKKNKCGKCSLHIGHIRCRVIETVIESVKIPCSFSRYGCAKKLHHREKLEHEEACNYVRCWCPHFDCSYFGTSSDFIRHIQGKHVNPLILFRFGGTIRLQLNTEQKKQFVLQEVSGTVIFVLNHFTDPLGSLVQVVCTGRTSKNKRYSYLLITSNKGGNSIKLESVVDNVRKLTEHTRLTNFLLVPKKFIASNANIIVQLTINKKAC